MWKDVSHAQSLRESKVFMSYSEFRDMRFRDMRFRDMRFRDMRFRDMRF